MPAPRRLNPDEHMRRLERAALQGDEDAAQALTRAFWRSRERHVFQEPTGEGWPWAVVARYSIPGWVLTSLWREADGIRRHDDILTPWWMPYEQQMASLMIGQPSLHNRNVYFVPEEVVEVLLQPWRQPQGMGEDPPMLLDVARPQENELRFRVELPASAWRDPRVPQEPPRPRPPFLNWDDASYVGDGDDGVYYGAVQGQPGDGWWSIAVVDSETGGFTDTVHAQPGHESEEQATEAARYVAEDWCAVNDVECD